MRRVVFSFFFLAGLAALPASAQAPVQLSADEIYFKAVDRLQSLSDPPFIAYDLHTAASFIRWHSQSISHIIVRSSDDRQFEQRVEEDGRTLAIDKTNYDIGENDVSPDAFIKMQHETDKKAAARASGGSDDSVFGFAPMVLPTPTAQDAGGLHDIAAVRALYNRTYRVNFAGSEPLAGCPSGAYHLKLQPRRDPNENALRDLWISTQTFDICRINAGIVASYGVFHAPVSAQVDFAAIGPYWLVTHVSASGRSRFMLVSATMNVDMQYANFALPKTEPAWLFDRRLYAAHEGLPAPTASPAAKPR